MNEGLRAELLALERRDLDLRARLVREGRLYEGYAEEMQEVHRENALRLQELVSRHGWPTLARAGEEGCRAAWLVAQHAICTPDLQRGFLVRLAEAAGNGEVPMRQVAYLTDRIRFNEDRPQVYGTVLDWNEAGELSCVVEDPANLAARWCAAGLPGTHEEHVAAARRQASAEGGSPPRDFAEARRRRLEWAKRVGWV